MKIRLLSNAALFIWKFSRFGEMTEFDEFSFFLGSVYEPLKSIDLPRPDNETLWDKLDHYYKIGKQSPRGLGPPLAAPRVCYVHHVTAFLCRWDFAVGGSGAQAVVCYNCMLIPGL